MKFSVITVCRNAEKDIAATIESVLSQQGVEIEYLIIDGQSTDRTMSIVSGYKKRLAKVVSEPDQGIYDAMNKGARLAQGDVLLFLNAGDRLTDAATLQAVAATFGDARTELVYGDVNQIDSDGDRSVVRFDHVNRWFLADTTICHQSTFVSRRLFERVGPYNTAYKIAADYDWLLKAIFKERAVTKHLRVIVCDFSMAGVSNSADQRQQVLKEYDQISEHYFSSILIGGKRLYRSMLRIGASLYRLFRRPTI